MRIHFEKSGGFTGMHEAVTLDTDKMPPDEAARLLHELDASGLLEQDPEALENAPQPGPDMITYELTLEVGNYETTYCLTDADTPESLQSLFRYLTVLARRSRRTDDSLY
jgi:hypothetical protein